MNASGTTQAGTEPSFTETTHGTAVVDPFYNERDGLRMRETLILGAGNRGLTYLEEKAMYNLSSKNKDEAAELDMIRRANQNWRRRIISGDHGLQRAPLVPLIGGGRGGTHNSNSTGTTGWNSYHGLGLDHVSSPRRQITRSNSFSGNNCYREPKVALKIHRHMLDQHLLGRPGVDDGEGSMTTPPVSLSADFFHPFFSIRSPEESVRKRNNGVHTSSNLGGRAASTTTTANNSNSLSGNLGSDEETNGARRSGYITSNSTDDSDSELETEMIYPRPNPMEPLPLNNVDQMAAVGAEAMQMQRQPPAMAPLFRPMIPRLGSRATSASAAIIPEMQTSPQHHDGAAQSGILSKIDLDVYSASSKSFKMSDDDLIGRQLHHYLKARFAAYHHCLEKHASKNDNDGFEETILDFWDEFFPQTANIQYYNKHTAVPRLSRLDEFLTKPCPKAVGIIQCEIERVKLGSKKSMKGRFFPTYEYRLFIRHRPSDPMHEFMDIDDHINDKNGRRDTILMMAKNRGRKHTESQGLASKKGSNNYYLTLPLQDDLDVHYKSVNGLEEIEEPSPNGVGSPTCSTEFSGLLGRLQSNFVGTEFQILTPRSTLQKRTRSLSKSMNIPRRSSVGSVLTPDDEILYDSGRHSDSSRRRSRFGRLSLRGRSTSNDNSTDIFEPRQSHSSPLTLRRSRSGDAAPGRNRKVSAAESFESKQYKVESQPLFFEVEDGAITYTANLLGSRPRIMDVCIPKVNHDGVGMEWKRYLENCTDLDASSSNDRLLNHLKQLQQNGQMDEHGRLINPATNDPEVLPTDRRKYSPPGDFGLLALQNRPPWWNVELGSFVLNFGGRVSVASVKNFQLCDRNDQDHIMLQFGRIEGRHAFTMDFRYPLTAVQAFAIAISSLQSKISFG
uniref:Tubby C-terminal domain-containing protein n=2 Tax=Pseudo-nitzschia australis TaxID=44445 RepID=A0A7S4EM77_9STRA